MTLRSNPTTLRSVAATAALLWIATVIAALPAAAQDPELVGDRPDQSESTVTVPVGYWQVETGVLYARDEFDSNRFTAWEYGGTLLRYGFSEKLEFRLGWDGYLDYSVEQFGHRFDSNGVGDAELGIKWNLRQGNGRSPAVAVIVATSVPVGDDDFTSDHFDPTVLFAFDHDLTDRWSLGWNVGARRQTLDGDDFSDTDTFGFYAASFAYEINEKVGTFFEVYGDVPFEDTDFTTHNFDTGLTFLVRPNVQLDLLVGVGISDDALDYLGGFGVTFRLPG